MIEQCPPAHTPEDAASTSAKVALLAETLTSLLSTTLTISTGSVASREVTPREKVSVLSEVASPSQHASQVVDSFCRFEELFGSTLLAEHTNPSVARSTLSLVANRKLLFSSAKALTNPSEESCPVAPSSSKTSGVRNRVDKSIVTLETFGVHRAAEASCGICKTQHRPFKVNGPHQNDSANHNDATTRFKKRLENANIDVCSTYTLWKFHRLKVQQCGRQSGATKSVPSDNRISENTRHALPAFPEGEGGVVSATSAATHALAENVTRDIALRLEPSTNPGAILSDATTPSFCKAAFATQACLNQTCEQRESDATILRLKPKVAEQTREECDGDRLLSLCVLSCQRVDTYSKLFKRRRNCLTLRLRHTTSSTALFHFSKHVENYEQFSKVSLVNSNNRRSLITLPARCSNSILCVIYFKLICCQPSCNSFPSSRSIPVLISCDRSPVLSLEKPVFTKTYNCSYFRHCYRQKYTRRRRRCVTSRKQTSSTKSTRDDVIDHKASTCVARASCFCTPNQTSNTQHVTTPHRTLPSQCPCPPLDCQSKSFNNKTCQTFNSRAFGTQGGSLWHPPFSWLSAIFIFILTPLLIVLNLVYRIIVILTPILLGLIDRFWRNPSSSKAFEESKYVRRTRLKNNDFLRSLLCLLVVFVCCVPHEGSSARASTFPLDPQRFVRSAPPQVLPDSYNHTEHPRGRICQSIDVRNSLANLELLRGCRVIEGFLQIFVEAGSAADWEEYSFPELVEVTDYLLLYRNTGPRSLGALFPSLALIRGRNLLYNYALVVHECPGIQELGLYELTDILRGSVHIMKNPTMCFVDTVDWDLISWTQGGHYIKDNRHPNECPICPLTSSGAELCMPSKVTPASRPLCVNTTHCQKMCKVECEGRSCYNNGYSCCNPACIGGCTGNTSSDCVGCRHLEFQGTCVDACDATSYSFIERRCVSNDECQALPPPYTPANQPVKHWKFVRNEFTGDNVCSLDCPKGYVEKEIPDGLGTTKFECQRCYGDCEKKCLGSNIESIQKLQQYKECTYIKGSLEIQIQNGANVVKELEENLGMVEVIEGYLKIARSYPIMSLNFFKKLRLIMGKELETNRFALVVLDNQNLMELWDFTKRNVSLEIRTGTIFFHFNPKLCYYHIENLASQAGLVITETEVPKSSNGDKAACIMTKIKADITLLSHDVAQIRWEKFDHYDSRALLSYLIFYKESKYQNVTMYDTRDACGGDGWKMEDFENIENKPGVPTDKPEDKWIYHILTTLKPFTQYAYYVRTYTIATERNGAMSPIQYFRTKPYTPSFPLDLIAYTLSPSEIQISWKPPKTPNGNVTHYFIVGYWERDDPKIIQTRNYCREPIILSGGGTLVSRPSTPAPPSPSSSENPAHVGAPAPPRAATGDEECVCSKKDEKSEEDKMKEYNRFIEIEFENALQNQVYVKSNYSDEALALLDQVKAKTNRVPVYESSGGDVSRRRRDVEAEAAENIFPDVTKQTGGGSGGQARPGGASSSVEENQTYVTVPSPAGNVTTRDGAFERFEFVVYGATSFVIRNLSHYAKYNIEVQACREVVPDERFDSNNSNCSRKSLETRRTAAKDGVDSINGTTFRLERSNGSWYALWEPPTRPNGLVVAYKIETARQDKSKYATPNPHCISKAEYDVDGRYDIGSTALLAGNYSIRVRAVSLYGEGAWSQKLYFVVPKPSMSDLELSIMIVLFVVLLLLITLGVVYYRREKVGARLTPSVNPEYIPVYTKDEWEVARSKVTILDELGNGSFGLVCRGLIRDFRGHAELPCAVKLVNDNASERERAEFLNEASVMKAFDAHHVVKLFGVVSEGHPTLVLMELMAGGDLKNYLRSCRPDAEIDMGRSPPTLKRILQMAAEIGDGMAYLADNKYVHRDLAARNCMVAEDLTVKVGDFGMTRDIYETEYYRKGSRGFLPVRWMAPESLKDGVFSSCSDVWSYGVVLWEIATLASQPYQGLTNEQVLNWVKGGGILVRPDNCPDRLFGLMRRCWQFKPSSRPTFSLLLADLEQDLDPAFRLVSYYHSDAAREHKLRMASKSETRTSSTTLDEQIPLHTTQDIEDFSLTSDSEGEEDNIHAAPSGYPPDTETPRDLDTQPCGTPRESNAFAKSSRNTFNSRGSYADTLGPYSDVGAGGRYSDVAAGGRYSDVAGGGRYSDDVAAGGRCYTDDDRLPGSKNSVGRYSEDSRSYLDSSRPSTLGRAASSDPIDREASSYRFGGHPTSRNFGDHRDDSDEKERLVSEDSSRRVSISRQNLGGGSGHAIGGGSRRNSTAASPAKNYAGMTSGNGASEAAAGNAASQPVTGATSHSLAGNTANSTAGDISNYIAGCAASSIAGNAASSIAGNAASSIAGNAASSLAGNAANAVTRNTAPATPRVIPSGLPSYLGGRFSTLAGGRGGFRSGPSNLPNSVATGESDSCAGGVGTDEVEVGSDGRGSVGTGANSVGVNSVGGNTAGVNNTRVNSIGVSNPGVNRTGVPDSTANSATVNNIGVPSSNVNTAGVSNNGVSNLGINGVSNARVNTSGVNNSGVNNSGVTSLGVNSSGVNGPNNPGLNNYGGVTAGQTGVTTGPVGGMNGPRGATTELGPALSGTANGHITGAMNNSSSANHRRRNNGGASSQTSMSC